MKKTLLLLFVLLTVIYSPAQNHSCVPIVAPLIPQTLRVEYEKKLSIAKEAYAKDSTDANALIWYGRRMAYLGNYNEAIEIYSKGIELHPRDARLYRHRGHRYLTVRCFDKAIADFKKASGLTKNLPDESEPDGLPNAQNIPTSTLQSNIWYHLGLAYYLKGDFKQALKAYEKGLAVSKNPDMYIATAYWMVLIHQRQGKISKAKKLFSSIDPGWKIIENTEYRKIIDLFYSKNSSCLDTLAGQANSLASASYGYGYGIYCLVKGNRQNAIRIFNTIIAGDQWSSFGFMAAEAALKKLR